VKTLTEETRAQLKKPMGRVMRAGEAAAEAKLAKKEGRLVVSVGDSSSRSLILSGVEPDIIVFDNMCMRMPTGSEVRSALTGFDGEGERV
jgi:uncharacterized protein (UPF0218 family)